MNEELLSGIDPQILKDYVATANNPKYNKDWNVINSKFPELKSYNPQILKDYVATANNPKYNKDWNVINSKFPELFSDNKSVPSKKVKAEQDGGSRSVSANGKSSSDSREQIKLKSSYDTGTNYMGSPTISESQKRLNEMVNMEANIDAGTLSEEIKPLAKSAVVSKLDNSVVNTKVKTAIRTGNVQNIVTDGEAKLYVEAKGGDPNDAIQVTQVKSEKTLGLLTKRAGDKTRDERKAESINPIDALSGKTSDNFETINPEYSLTIRNLKSMEGMEKRLEGIEDLSDFAYWLETTGKNKELGDKGSIGQASKYNTQEEQIALISEYETYKLNADVEDAEILQARLLLAGGNPDLQNQLQEQINQKAESYKKRVENYQNTILPSFEKVVEKQQKGKEQAETYQKGGNNLLTTAGNIVNKSRGVIYDTIAGGFALLGDLSAALSADEYDADTPKFFDEFADLLVERTNETLNIPVYSQVFSSDTNVFKVDGKEYKQRADGYMYDEDNNIVDIDVSGLKPVRTEMETDYWSLPSDIAQQATLMASAYASGGMTPYFLSGYKQYSDTFKEAFPDASPIEVAGYAGFLSAVEAQAHKILPEKQLFGSQATNYLIQSLKGVDKATRKEAFVNAVKTYSSVIFKENLEEQIPLLINATTNYITNNIKDSDKLNEDIGLNDEINTLAITTATSALTGLNMARGTYVGNRNAIGYDQAIFQIGKDPKVFDQYRNLIQDPAVREQLGAELVDKSILDAFNVQKTLKKLPSVDNVTLEKYNELKPLLQQKEELEEQKKNVDKAFHEEIKAKIETVDEQIRSIYNRKETAPEVSEPPTDNETTETEGEQQQGQVEETKKEVGEKQINTKDDLKSALSEGKWGMMSGENPDAKPLTPEENKKRNEEAKKWLIEKGYSPKEIKGRYGNDENSFLVLNLSKKDAVEFANEFNQESVATDEGLVFQDGSFYPRTEDDFDGNYDDNYSTYTLPDGSTVSFQIGYDFDNKVTPTDGTGKSTQDFFGTVVEGGDERYTPSKPFEYEEEFEGEAKKFQENYDSKKGNFDDHIATSIPTFRETQVKKGNAIVKLLENEESPVVYDLGGSEGSWVKTITEESGGKIKTINLDPNPKMQDSFNKNKPENSEMSLEAFHQGWDDVPAHTPKEKADVVHESMMFQFIDNDGERKQYIEEVTDKYLKDDGVFITEEKFKMNTEEEYKANEKLKESHKDKYYTKEQQSLKSDEVLVGMKKNQANFDQYVSELKEKFDHVEVYWKAGNFRGIVASNSKEKVDKFLSELGDTSNNYTHVAKTNLSSSLGIDEFINRLNNIDKKLDDFGKNTLGMNLPVVVAKGAIKAMKVAAKTAKVTADVISAGINYVHGTNWYKNLTDQERQQFDDSDLLDLISNTDTTESYDDSDRNRFKNSKEAYDKVKEDARKAREESSVKKQKLSEKVGKWLNKFVDETFDRQGSVKRALNKIKLKDVVSYMVAKQGASSYAKNRVGKAYEKTFKGLTNQDIENLEEIIQLKRTISIADNREQRGLPQIKRQGGLSKAEAEAALQGYNEVLGDEKYDTLIERADNYFNIYKGLLNDMLVEGLINQEAYDSMAEIDYKPTQYLKFLEDMEGSFLPFDLDTSGELPLSREQVRSIKEGYEGSELMDAWYIMQRSIANRTRAVFSNRLNSTFAEEFKKQEKQIEQLREKEDLTKAEQKRIDDFDTVASNVIVDNIVGFTDSGNPKYSTDGQTKKGYSSLYYYENGVKNRIWLKDDFYNKFTDTNNNYLNSNVKENIALVSGTAFVKTLATGNNPLFFITNTPRDFAFILAFSKEYGNEIISNSIKLAIDGTKGVRDVLKNNENYKKYLEYGGGMDFLALQGKYKDKGWTKAIVDTAMSQKWQDRAFRNRVFNFIGKLNLASEVGLRMAVFNKSIKNQLNGRDIDSLTKKEKDLIYTNAVKSARELTDFNQGGKLTKAVDAGIPYLNASIQGTRAAIENFAERPFDTSVRLAQITGYSVGSTIAAGLAAISLFRSDDDDDKDKSNSQIYFETIEQISQYDLQNYFIIPLGIKNEKGNWKYMRIAKAQSLTPILNLTEHMVRTKMADFLGAKYDGNSLRIVTGAVNKNVMPIEMSTNPLDVAKDFVSRNPAVSLTIAAYGFDAYTGQPLDWENGKIPAELEGFKDKNVEPIFKKIGDVTDVSPVRLQKSLESLITTPSTNPYVGMAYSLGNLGAMEYDNGESASLSKTLLEPSMRRLIKGGSDYNIVAKTKDKIKDETLKSYKAQIKLESNVRDAVKELKSEKITREEFSDKVKKLIEDNPEDATRIKSWANSEKDKGEKMSSFINTVRYEKNKEVRAYMLIERYGDDLKNLRQYLDNASETERLELKQLKESGGLDKETYQYYLHMIKK